MRHFQLYVWLLSLHINNQKKYFYEMKFLTKLQQELGAAGLWMWPRGIENSHKKEETATPKSQPPTSIILQCIVLNDTTVKMY